MGPFARVFHDVKTPGCVTFPSLHKPDPPAPRLRPTERNPPPPPDPDDSCPFPAHSLRLFVPFRDDRIANSLGPYVDAVVHSGGHRRTVHPECDPVVLPGIVLPWQDKSPSQARDGELPLQKRGSRTNRCTPPAVISVWNRSSASVSWIARVLLSLSRRTCKREGSICPRASVTPDNGTATVSCARLNLARFLTVTISV